MNIGTQMKAIKVERIGGPRQTPVAPMQIEAPVPAMATVDERVLATV